MKIRIWIAAVLLLGLVFATGCQQEPPEMDKEAVAAYVQEELRPAMDCLEWCLGQGLPAQTDAQPLEAGGCTYYPSAQEEICRAGDLWDACRPYLTEAYFTQLVGDLSSPGGRYYEVDGLLYLDPEQAGEPLPHAFFDNTAFAFSRQAGEAKLTIEYQPEGETRRQYNELELVWQDGSWKVQGRTQEPVPI